MSVMAGFIGAKLKFKLKISRIVLSGIVFAVPVVQVVVVVLVVVVAVGSGGSGLVGGIGHAGCLCCLWWGKIR